MIKYYCDKYEKSLDINKDMIEGVISIGTSTPLFTLQLNNFMDTVYKKDLCVACLVRIITKDERITNG